MEESGLPDLNVGDGGISAVSVKLRGLPFKALEQDISDFFDGYNVQRALLKRYPDGRPNGEVPAPLNRNCCTLCMRLLTHACCECAETLLPSAIASHIRI